MPMHPVRRDVGSNVEQDWSKRRGRAPGNVISQSARPVPQPTYPSTGEHKSDGPLPSRYLQGRSAAECQPNQRESVRKRSSDQFVKSSSSARESISLSVRLSSTRSSLYCRVVSSSFGRALSVGRGRRTALFYRYRRSDGVSASRPRTSCWLSLAEKERRRRRRRRRQTPLARPVCQCALYLHFVAERNKFAARSVIASCDAAGEQAGTGGNRTRSLDDPCTD